MFAPAKQPYCDNGEREHGAERIPRWYRNHVRKPLFARPAVEMAHVAAERLQPVACRAPEIIVV